MTSQLLKAVVGAVFVALICCGQDKDAALLKREAAAREMMALTNAEKIGTQMFESMKATLRLDASGDFDKIWDDVAKEIDWNGLTELMVPTYAKHFTQEELDAIIAFYKSPAGRKMIEETPKVMQEVMPAIMSWNDKMREKVRAKLEK